MSPVLFVLLVCSCTRFRVSPLRSLACGCHPAWAQGTGAETGPLFPWRCHAGSESRAGSLPEASCVDSGSFPLGSYPQACSFGRHGP